MVVLFFILKTILIVFATIIFIILLFISTPFRYELMINLTDEIKGKGEVRFLFGIIKIEISKYDGKPILKVYLTKITVFSKEITFDKKEKEKGKEKDKKSRNTKTKKFFNKQFLGELKNYIMNIIYLIKPEKFQVSGVYGFEDPSITGLICAIRPFVNFCDMNITPDFEEDNTDITVFIIGGFNLIVIGFKTLQFILNKKVRKIIFSKNL